MDLQIQLTVSSDSNGVIIKGGGSESTIIVGPSNFVLVYALHSLEYVLGFVRFHVFVPKLFIIIAFETLFICLYSWLSGFYDVNLCSNQNFNL